MDVDMTVWNERDRLTGVYSREAFCARAEQLLQENPDIRYDIVISDFMNFKYYNARYGSEAGDLLLRKTGEVLSFAIPDGVCGRFGSDHFVTILRHMDEYAISSLERFRLPPEAAQDLPSANIVVKFGVCDDVDHNTPVAVLCDHALIALTSVKHKFGRNVGIYNTVLAEALRQEFLIEENMLAALEQRQFQIYYQPKQNLATGRICGAEALVRWVHPTLGFMNPALFIPLFEKNGFITSLDSYVWNTVCRDLAHWREAGLPVLPVSVNVSRKDLERYDLSEQLIRSLDRLDLDHSLLHVEITESAYSENPGRVGRHVQALHNAGFQIELDDFGSGYTSLSTLNDMPLDILKMDMSLLHRDVPGSNRSVLKFAMQLAGILGVTTIQEGVETQEQLERLKSLGCNIVQGFLYSKPLSREDYEVFLRTHAAD